MQAEEQDGDDKLYPNSIVPLRTILGKFLNLVENYESRRNGDADLYEKEFQELKQFSEDLKSDSFYQCKDGEKSVNRKKNRYKDILPFDFSRVVLSENDASTPGSDYVNANFIKGASGSSSYIACQGPLPHTVNDFWRMVVECKVQVIVMACMEQESGKHKCENYWVDTDGVEREFGKVTVWLKKCRNVCPDFLVRTMRIRYPNAKGEMEERNVCQFHYSAWPDHGVPTKVRPLLDMVRLIRDCQPSETLPVLVHCSAGCGRTGTICAIDYVWGLLRLGKLSPQFRLFNLVREMRRQRIAMVQTKDQYILVHRAVKELFQEQLKIIDAHPYANVDQNGLPLELKEELEEPVYATIYVEKRNELTSATTRVSNKCTSDNSNSIPKPHSRPSTRSTEKCETEDPLQLAEEKKPNSDESFMGKQVNTNIVEGKLQKSPHDGSTIELCSSSTGEDTVDSNIFPVANLAAKVPVTSTSPNRGVSILRKPSIVKLRALFEKTSRQEKYFPRKANITPGGLSRAKSDVTTSSRLYSFTSPFSGSKNSKGQTSSPTKESFTPTLTANNFAREKVFSVKNKPPIMAKPTLPVKRSKSLKIHPVESSLPATPATDSQHSFIKVCVKQGEIPKLQTVQSPSEKPSSREDSDCENRPLQECHKSGRERMEPVRNYSLSRSDSTDSSRTPRKPSITIKVASNAGAKPSADSDSEMMPKSNQHTNELEQITKVISCNDLKKKKYDTLTPKSAQLVCSLSATLNGSLSRSQSHVWQPLKGDKALASRIFSNENLNKSEADKKNQIESLKLERVWAKQKTENNNSKQDAFKRDKKNSISSVLNDSMGRSKIPKASGHFNYSVGPESSSSTSQQPRFDCGKAFTGNSTRRANGEPGGNSSLHSSISLPSTPTESMDRRHPRSQNNNFQKQGNLSLVSAKSILKGSLSSTPSDSDERLDSSRYNHPSISSATSAIKMSNSEPVVVDKFANGSRPPLGIRERRNSFRQAVWKEAQCDAQQHGGCQASSTYIDASPLCETTNVIPKSGNDSEGQMLSHRNRKDYETIWPHNGSSYLPSKQESVIASQNGNCLLTATHTATTVNNRFEDLKLLLEELKTPLSSKAESHQSHVSAGNSVISMTGKSQNLKHQRSLKAPSRSNYEQTRPIGSISTLSCFTFKKPTSLESVSDYFDDEERQRKNSGSALFLRNDGQAVDSRNSTSTSSASHGFHSGRYANDYVTLEQCRTVPRGFQVGEDEVDTTVRQFSYRNGNIETPVPPPRTKAKRNNQAVEKQIENSDVTSSVNGSNRARRLNTVDSPTISPTSTTRAKAIGLFHDMKSKLVNWTEPSGKERSQSQNSNNRSSGNQSKRGSDQSNESGSSGNRENETQGNSGIKNDFLTSLTNPHEPISSRSSSKHQYL